MTDSFEQWIRQETDSSGADAASIPPALTVADLIGRLATLPADAPVLVKGWESGVDYALAPALVMIQPNGYTEWVDGIFETCESGSVAVYLGPNRDAGRLAHGLLPPPP